MSEQNQEHEETVREDDPFLVRRRKRERLIEAGVDPYGSRFEPTHHAAGIEADYAHLEDGQDTEDTVTIAGRVMAIRDQGKVAFIVLRDEGVDIQLFVRINVIGEDGYAEVKDLDIGDWIGATGTILKTRRGQLSVSPTSITLLSKSLRPLPEKFHGLADTEIRYRQRYVDLIMNPEVRDVFTKRFAIIAAIRSYMTERGFLEVETPMLHPIPGGATAKPFVTHHNTLDKDFYLRIAPELYLKRLLVGGFNRVFEINRSFRNEGVSTRHNPEFTMIEAYQAFADIDTMKELTRGMIQAAAKAIGCEDTIEYQGTPIRIGGEWASRTMADLVSEKVEQPVSMDTPREELLGLLAQHHIAVEGSWGTGRLIAELFDELVEHTLIDPTFVVDYPQEVSPLAKRKADDPRLTDRFELFIGGREFANAFSELNDPVDQEERFVKQVEAKEAGDEEAMGHDTDYIRALEYGMPPAGGVGVGVDRLVMLLTDQPSIRDVLLFPHMRDETPRDQL